MVIGTQWAVSSNSDMQNGGDGTGHTDSSQSQTQSQTQGPDINIHIGPSQSQSQAQSQAQGLDLINAGLTAAGFNWWTRCMLFTAFHISPGKIFKRSALNTTGSSRISLRQ